MRKKQEVAFLKKRLPAWGSAKNFCSQVYNARGHQSESFWGAFFQKGAFLLSSLTFTVL